MTLRASHLTLFVLDQDQAHDNYVNKMGFRIHTDMSMDDGYRWLSVTPPEQPELEIVLMDPDRSSLDEEQAKAVRKLLEAHALGNAVFRTDDCQKTYEQWSAKGIEFPKPPTEEFYGIEATFRDGCGNWFSLTQRTEEV